MARMRTKMPKGVMTIAMMETERAREREKTEFRSERTESRYHKYHEQLKYALEAVIGYDVIVVVICSSNRSSVGNNNLRWKR